MRSQRKDQETPMPTILLKTLAPLTETSDAFDYADQIKTLMRHPPVNIGGFTLDQVKMAASIIKEVDQAEDGALIMGKAQWNYLCEMVRGAQWALAAPQIVEFCDDVLEAV
jgi:hypothetical protein